MSAPSDEVPCPAPQAASFPGLLRFVIAALRLLLPVIAGMGLIMGTFGLFRWEVEEMCELTGSRRDSTAYPFGIRVQVVESPSSLERYLKQRHPERLQHRWKSCSRISRGWFSTTYADTTPPRGFFDLPGFCLDRFVESASEQEVLALHDLVRTGNQAAIDRRFLELMELTLQ